MLFCDDHHQGFCHTMLPWQTISHANSLILIDLQRACLARTAGNFTSKYIALSYVWGVLPGILESNINNIDHLCIPGSLDKLENLSRIPRTIRDAMTLTKAMNIRYLWVDRLCIIQDDFYHFRDQIQQMASVFANSYFTIIAADGNDANYGLHGVDSESSPRYYKRSIFRFSESAHMVAQPEVESHRNPKVWHTRGWTFQERAVSRRTLVFTDETVYWQCRRAAWHESQAAAPDGVLRSGPQSAVPRGAASRWPSYALRLNPWPDLQQYFELVSGYNDRKLTFERDALNAFTAITSAMSCTFQGGFHWGIPVLVFDIGLLWSRFSPLMRRKDFPSWSWLGWSGSVILPKGYEEAWDPAFVCWEPVVEVSPLFKWYVADDQGHSVGLIDNSYYRYSSAASQPDLQLPEGWSATCDKSYRRKGFAHVSLPEQTFRFPFPAIPPVPERSFSSLLLKFSSQSCTMSLGTAFAQQEAYPTCLIVDVMDNNGRWAGVVESLFVEEDEYTHGQECELVAISVGSALRRDEDGEYSSYQAFDEMFRKTELSDIDKYEFYNVLWIERKRGVAYRKAMGRIWAPVWKRQDLKDVEILLG